MEVYASHYYVFLFYHYLSLYPSHMGRGSQKGWSLYEKYEVPTSYYNVEYYYFITKRHPLPEIGQRIKAEQHSSSMLGTLYYKVMPKPSTHYG